MPDFDLEVGVDVALSTENIKNGISDIIKKINSSPPKIKVDIDNSSLTEMKSQIEKLMSSIGSNKTNASTKGIKSAETELKKLASTATSAKKLLQNNIGASDTTSYVKLQKELKNVNDVLDLCGNDAKKLKNALKEVGIDSTKSIEIITSAMATLRKELQNAGQGSTASLTKVTSTLNQMQKLYNSNPNLQSTDSFVTLKSQIESLSSVVSECSGNANMLDSAFGKFKVDGATAIEQARLAMENCKTAVINLKSAGQGSTASLTKVTSTLNQMQKLYNSNPNLQSTDSFVALNSQIENFKTVLTTCKGNVDNLDSAFNSVGVDGATAIEQARLAMENCKTAVINLKSAEEQEAAATNAKNKAAKDTAQTEKYAASVYKEYQSTIVSAEKTLNNWTKAQKSSSQTSREAYNALAAAKTAMENAASAYINGTGTANELAESIAKYKSTLKTSEQIIRANGDATKTLGERLGSAAEKFTSWLSVSQVIMYAYNSVKKMVSATIELDTAMTELKKVTDETDATYEKFLKNSASTAKSIGATVSDTVNASADFARLGYSIDEASGLAESALIYKNVGDGIEDVSEASESIISTMKAFGIEAENSMSIVDKFNEVGNNFAISSEGVGVALQKSAAALAAGNNTIDESIGLITGMNAVVQDPEVVGTAVKTLSMYLRAAKTEAEDAGEDTEGMASSVAELREDILTLTKQKVDIQIDDNNFKSTYQIIKEISEVWDSTAEIDQAALLKLIAGKRNANSVQSLITNFQDAEDAAVSAANSAGSAVNENEKYLDSAEGKISQFKASFEELSEVTIDSEFLKTLISSGNTLLTVLTKIVDTVGALPVLITTIGTALSAVKNVGRNKLFFLKMNMPTVMTFCQI